MTGTQAHGWNVDESPRPVLDGSDGGRALRYLEYRPPPPNDLRRWVESIAVAALPEPIPVRTWRIIPDARPRLWIPLDGGSEPIFVGNPVAPRDLGDPRGGITIVVRFAPWASGGLGHHAWVEEAARWRESAPFCDSIQTLPGITARWLQNRIGCVEPDTRVVAAWRSLSGTPQGTAQTLADRMGVSGRTVRRLVRSACGCDLRTARQLERLRAALRLLRSDLDLSWSAAAFGAGYADQSHLYRAFRRWVGMSPALFFGQGHHHLNDVFAGRLDPPRGAPPFAPVAIGGPTLRPVDPPHHPARDRRRFPTGPHLCAFRPRDGEAATDHNRGS